MRRILRVAIETATPQTITAPVIASSASLLAPASNVAISLQVPVVVAGVKYLPEPEWSDQAGDLINWQDGSLACWQGSGLVPIFVSLQIATPIVTSSSSVIEPIARATVSIATPIVTSSSSVIEPIAGATVSIAAPIIESHGAIIAINLGLEGSIIPGLATSIATAIAPDVLGSMTIAVDVVSSIAAAIDPTTSSLVTLVPPVILASGFVSSPQVAIVGALVPDVASAIAIVMPPGIAAPIAIPIPTISATCSLVAPTVTLGGGLDWDLVADRQTFALSADIETVFTVSIRGASFTAPRKPARPAGVLV